MKSKGPVFIILLFVCAALLAFINNHPYEELAIDAQIPLSDVKMKDVSGRMLSLDDARQKNGLLVIFSCNTCPYVIKMQDRIRAISELCAEKEIGCVIVNSNEAMRKDEDSFEAMQAYYKEQKLRCFYAVDERSKLANAFGAGRTPQTFLFNSKGRLVYKGAIDDNVKDATLVKATYLKDAIGAVINNERPAVQETKSIGCTIKRAE